MPDSLTFAEFLAHGVLRHVSPISARRRAAEALPHVIVEQLCAHPSREEIQAWRHAFLEQHWPSLLKEQAGATGHGWPELIAAMAVVLELLWGTLPREVAEHLAAHPHLRPHFDELRAPWQSFALVVEHEARPVRLLVTVSGRSGHDGELTSLPSVEQRDDVHWWIEGEKPQGRSHTLLLALLALARWEGLRLPEGRPIAATGELASDGHSILRVELLIDKLHAWFDAEPGGLLVTSTPAPEELHRLLRPFDHHAGATRRMRALRELPLERWLAAESLEELRVKLERWLSLEASVAERGLIAWDGRRIEPEALAAWRFEWVRTDGTPSPERTGDDMILDACWHMVASGPRGAGPSGVVIYGEPGSGKSLLSRILERRFVSGPLGALGLAVRRSARELAGALQSAPEASLPELLAARVSDSRATLYRNLLAARRLFVIVDGLDEIPSPALAAIGRRLADDHALFIVTSRSIRAGLDALPSHLVLRIQPLQRHEGADLLQQLGRRELAEQLRRSQFSAPLRQWRTSDPVDALCRTPFHVSLLARLVHAGERLHEVDPAELYRRAFEALLEHAVGDERLTAEQADLLRRTLPSLAGALALDWLRSPSGFLDDAAVTVRLEAAELSGSKGIAAQRALEFGYLLAPGAGNWEFSHRALAEWTAASALALDARRHLRRLEDSGISDPAAAERKALHFILAEDRPLHESRWWQLLELYAPRSIAPLVLVESLAGPQALERSTDEHTIRKSFRAALALAARARWNDPEAARIAWALLARAALLAAPGTAPHQGPFLELQREDEPDRERFLRAVGPHLPPTLDGLIDAASRTAEQCDAFRRDPARLLPFCGTEQMARFEPLLREGTPEQQAEILERAAALRFRLPGDILDRLASDLPLRLDDERVRDGETRWRNEARLTRLERATHDAAVSAGHELPWPILRRRLLDWPAHLSGALLAWFAVPPRPSPGAPGLLGLPDRRRDALGLLLGRMVEAEGELLVLLHAVASLPHRDRLADPLRVAVDRDEDHPEPWRRLAALAKSVGWPLDRARDYARDEPPPDEVRALRQASERFEARRGPVVKVLEALRDAAQLDTRMAELWPLLPTGGEERRTLLDLLVSARHLPPCISLDELLDRFEADRSGLPWELRPRDEGGIAMHPEHEARWRTLASSGCGKTRLFAVLWCAERERRDPVTAVAGLLGASDPELERLAILWLEQQAHGRVASEPPPAPPSFEQLARMPLAYRVELNAPGSRVELIEAIERAAPGFDGDELAALAASRGVREALPALHRRFAAHPTCRCAEAIAKLAPPGDRSTARMLLEADATGYRPPPELLEHLTLDELPVVLARNEPPGTHFGVTPESRLLSRPGVEAYPLLLDALRRRLAERAALRASSREDHFHAMRNHASDAWVSALGPAVLETLDVARTPMDAIAALLFEVIGGDRHQVFSMPGPLGSEYDEPADLVFESTLEGRAMIDAAVRAFESRIAAHPEEASLAERLLEHPSETLHSAVFARLAARASPDQVAVLALRALEAHLATTDTRHEGDIGRLLLASISRGGSGSINVHQPEVGKQLAAAVRDHLTFAHRDLLDALSRHEQQALRALACTWIGELGTAAWTAILAPRLDDSSPRVVVAALEAWARLDQGSLDAALGACPRARWTYAHSSRVLDWLLYREGFPGWLQRRDPREAMSFPLLARLTAGFLEQALGCGEGDRLLEAALEVLDEGMGVGAEGPLASASLRKAAAQAPAELRAVLYRTLARRGCDAIAADLEPLLSYGDPEEQVLAAESLGALGRSDLAEPILRVWNERLAPCRYPGEDIALRLRLAWMLERAPSVLAPLVVHLLGNLPDDGEGALTRESEALVDAASRAMKHWGPDAWAPALDLIGECEWGNSHAEQVLVQLFKGCTQLVEEVSRRAAGNRSYRLLLHRLREPDPGERMAALRRFLQESILPASWSRSG